MHHLVTLYKHHSWVSEPQGTAELLLWTWRRWAGLDMEREQFWFYLFTRSITCHSRLAGAHWSDLYVRLASEANLLASRPLTPLLFSHLKPGGWVEFQAIVGLLGCDDDSIPEGSYLRRFSDMMESASSKFGASLTDPMKWKSWFEERGYQNVTQKVFKLPFNPWPKDPRMKLLGAWEMENLLSGLEAMVNRMFQKGLGWSDAEVAVFLAYLRKEVKNPQMHGYWP